LLITFKDVRWFAAAHVVEYAFVAILLLISYRNSNGKTSPLRFDLSVAKRVLKRSYHFILSGMMVALYGQMDRVMLKSMISEEAVGFYSAAATINNCWVFILVALTEASSPVIVSKYPEDKEGFEKGLIRLYGIILYIAFFVAICITLLSKPLILLLFGGDYLPGRLTLCILCWGTPFAYLGVARHIWLVTHKKQKYIKYISAAGALCNLVLNAVLIPVWGIHGAALATMVTRFFTNFVIDFLIPGTRESGKLYLKALVFWKYLK
jgi:O-antigen/teichoic acid export membrane protein